MSATAAARERWSEDPVARSAHDGFELGSRVRRARVFHPDGIAFEARLAPAGDPRARDRSGLFHERDEHDGVVRLSRGAGLPAFLPDVLGLALRLRDAHGPARHQDFLLVSSGRAPVLRHAIAPGPRGFRGEFFSSVLPYRLPGGELRLIGVLPTPRARSSYRLDGARREAPDSRYELCWATLRGEWEPLGELTVGPALPDRLAEEIEFNPWNTGEELEPAGPLMRVRRPAYDGSQSGRG